MDTLAGGTAVFPRPGAWDTSSSGFLRRIPVLDKTILTGKRMAFETGTKVPAFKSLGQNSKGYLWSVLQAKSAPSHQIYPHLLPSSCIVRTAVRFYADYGICLLAKPVPSRVTSFWLFSEVHFERAKIKPRGLANVGGRKM